jgi:hypothetical protein
MVCLHSITHYWLYQLLLGFVFGVLSLIVLLLLPPVRQADEGIGMKEELPAPRPASSTLEPAQEPQRISYQEEEKLWYYLDQNHQQYGPISLIGLRELWNTGKVELTSYVWTEGMEKWEKVESLPDLQRALAKD